MILRNLRIMTKPFTGFLWMGWLRSWGSMGRIEADIALSSWLFRFRPCSEQGQFTPSLPYLPTKPWMLARSQPSWKMQPWIRSIPWLWKRDKKSAKSRLIGTFHLVNLHSAVIGGNPEAEEMTPLYVTPYEFWVCESDFDDASTEGTYISLEI